MNKKAIIKVTIVVIIMHFMITSLISHYIAVQIGTQMGQVVAGGLAAAGKNDEGDAKNIYQNMKDKSEDIKNTWEIPELLISLPIKPLFNSLLKEIRLNQMNKVITKEISRDQFRTQGMIIDYTAMLLNSFALGLLVSMAMKIRNQKITKGST